MVVMGRGRMGSRQPDAGRGVFGITTVAELFGISVQTLRLYEARGLLDPARTDGGTRRYSADDVDRVQRIGELIGAGLNLAGVAMVLELELKNSELQGRPEPGSGTSTPEAVNQDPVRSGSASSRRGPAADQEAVQRSGPDRRSRHR